MIIDDKGRLFSKISIVDIAVVVFLICAITFVGLKFFSPAGSVGNSETVKCEYTFKVEEIRQATVTALEKSVGKTVYDEDGADLGTIVEIVSVNPFKDAVKKADGSMVLSEVPDKYEIVVRVEVDAKMTAEGISVARKKELTVGSHILLNTPEITTESVITSVSAK